MAETKPVTYRGSGVDIGAGDRLVDRLKEKFPGIGGFGGAFPFDPSKYKKPVLVAGTDGVGTKLLLAIECGRLEGVGYDLVGMCANDVASCGAQPLFFLDYYATGKLDVEQAEEVVMSIGAACREAGCVLLGGETAEMPGLYAEQHFDLAGFCVGVADEGNLLGPEKVKEGDILIGMPSSGIHSNGFSLVRKIVSDEMITLSSTAPWGEGDYGAELLTPTRLYVKSVLAAMEAGGVTGAAHITGGGLPGNVARAIPEGLSAEIDTDSWDVPPVFDWLAKTGPVEWDEMLSTFNMGVGMVLVVRTKKESKILRALEEAGEEPWRLGRVVRGDKRVTLV
jgi:phosphoribosylformylglycinamidine cyclo-ligase